jgi:hypothetical protein
LKRRFQKRAKIFAPAGVGDIRANAYQEQKFFGYFFSKK